MDKKKTPAKKKINRKASLNTESSIDKIASETNKDISLKKTESPENIQALSGQKSLVKKQKNQPAEIKEEERANIDPEALDRGDIPMNLVSHLDEFRSRFLRAFIAILVITFASFFLSDQLLYILNKPYLATGFKLNIFNMIDGFLLRMKASLIAGILLGFPYIVYEIWKYLAPAINKQDRKFSVISIISAVLLFYMGVTLTYLSLPMAIAALLSFTPPGMTNTINASEYLSFVFMFSFAMGGVFELPIIIMVLTKIGIVTPQFLISKRKWAIVLIWISAAIITPTVDPLTQSLVAVPLMLLYELSIIISKIMVKRKKKKELMAG